MIYPVPKPKPKDRGRRERPTVRVGELFAGIGGFGLAAQRAGCSLRWAVEIDDFAMSVYRARLASRFHWPDVQMFPPPGSSDRDLAVDCITAGFPCQDLSVAGKRKGLVGERSGLFWEIVRIAARLRPRWLLLENVPGLLSSHKGRDFETVLAALDELGYGVAWRVLDAQFFGVPQRRRRVFIVGHLGAECPAEVLFESEGVSGDSQKGRKARAGVTQSLTRSLGSGGADDNDAQGGLIVAGTIDTHRGIGDQLPMVAHQCHGSDVGPMGTLRRGNGDVTGGVPFIAWPITSTSYKGHDEDTDTIVAHSLSAEGADASEDGTGRGTPIVAFATTALDTPRDDGQSPPLRVNPNGQGTGSGPSVFAAGGSVRPRRLTPRECERLQGFPDDWTLIDGASDSARYRALGNAVAVPVVEWILRRLRGVA